MIKAKNLLLAIVLLVTLTSCANDFQSTSERHEQNQTAENITLPPDTTENADKSTPVGLSAEDFIVEDENTFIELGGNYETLKTSEEIVEARYLDEKRAYDTYVYTNFIISTEPVNNTIWFINLVTFELKTSRGISIGDSISDVFEKYGFVDGDSSELYVYHYDGKKMTFYVDKDGKVSNIIFEIV